MADSSMARALSRSKTELTSTNTRDSCCIECESVTSLAVGTGLHFGTQLSQFAVTEG
jgi:hypothetical protein